MRIGNWELGIGNWELGIGSGNYPIAFCLELVVFSVTIYLFTRALVKKPGFLLGKL
ncbi:MAG: hypothetical protein F6K47_13560 [Symploca sp. SIO2E6]|nr:hypothetical protein [Symploca sp. SIO2E6]